MARLIRDKQPKLFDYYLSLRDKQVVKDKLQVPMGEPVLLTAAQYTRNQGCTTLVVPITQTASNPNSIIVFDLMEDPRTLLFMPDEKFFTVRGINRIALNRCPFVSPLAVLTEPVAARLGIDKKPVCQLGPVACESIAASAYPQASSKIPDAPKRCRCHLTRKMPSARNSAFCQNFVCHPPISYGTNFKFDDSKFHELLRRYISATGLSLSVPSASGSGVNTAPNA